MQRVRKSGRVGGVLAAVLLVCVGMAQTGSATLISIDLGPNKAPVTTTIDGSLSIGDLKLSGNGGSTHQIGIWENSGTANYWNYTSYAGASGLYDANGNVTSVGVSAPTPPHGASASNWGVDDLLGDGVYADPGYTVPWTVTGLTPNQNYKLVVYMSASYSSTAVTVNNVSPITYTGTKSPANYTEGTQFWYFNVQADANGKLNGISGFTAGDTTHNTVTGFQLDVIPEPGSLSLLGLLGGSLFLRRKLRQRR